MPDTNTLPVFPALTHSPCIPAAFENFRLARAAMLEAWLAYLRTGAPDDVIRSEADLTGEVMQGIFVRIARDE